MERDGDGDGVERDGDDDGDEIEAQVNHQKNLTLALQIYLHDVISDDGRSPSLTCRRCRKKEKGSKGLHCEPGGEVNTTALCDFCLAFLYPPNQDSLRQQLCCEL